MRILNAMLSRGLGGIEQAFLDYNEALTLTGHEVHALIHPGAAVRKVLEEKGMPFYALRNMGPWDPLAISRLWFHLNKLIPDLYIAHGNRAISLLAYTESKPLIGVMHNYKIDCKRLNGAFAPTQDLVHYAIGNGIPKERVIQVPNMTRAPDTMPLRHWHGPPVIGAMGRLVAKKGFDVFIEALALLKSKGVRFHALLAGDGPAASELLAMAVKKELIGALSFPGWVSDKRAFWDSIDLFCLPSHHEPFGIVALEAMAQGIPVVATASEGPSEILRTGKSGILVPTNDAVALASGIRALLGDQEKARQLGQGAWETVRENYDINVVRGKLDLAVRSCKRL